MRGCNNIDLHLLYKRPQSNQANEREQTRMSNLLEAVPIALIEASCSFAFVHVCSFAGCESGLRKSIDRMIYYYIIIAICMILRYYVELKLCIITRYYCVQNYIFKSAFCIRTLVVSVLSVYTLILSCDRTSFGDRVRIERDAFHK